MADREKEYDLLTAALIGLTVGAAVTFLLRRPTTKPRMSPMLAQALKRARRARSEAAKLGRRGAAWAAERGEDLWEAVPRDEIRKHVDGYLEKARGTIDDAVDTELRNLRRALRRQRKRLGV
jgi:hypothetical protein